MTLCHPSIAPSLDLISEAIERTNAKKVFALFSGGNDSLVALHIARQHPLFTAAVHCHTGVGVEATSEFVRDTCADLKCPLIEYCATKNVKADGTPDPQIYEDMVMQHGFPGPTKYGHGKMYNRLKERALWRLARAHCERGERMIFITGVRSEESRRRMGHVEPIQKEGHRIWTAICHDWTKTDVANYRDSQSDIQQNPVTALICKSGECMCGAFGQEGELEELLRWQETRQLGKRLLDLQSRVLKTFPWKWHEGPPKWFLDSRRGQRMLFEMSRYAIPDGQSLCAGCVAGDDTNDSTQRHP